MPKLKKQSYFVYKITGAHSVGVDIHISASGEFYGYLPEYMKDAINSNDVGRLSKGVGIKVTANTLEKFNTVVQKALSDFHDPEITTEEVILFNIESHVSFAKDDDGNIFPNAGYPNAKWNHENRAMFGDHHATNSSSGGFSLVIGAKAMTKKTYKHGDNVKVVYENYYKGGSHLSHDNPAQILNSWSGFSLPKHPREIPYTDEAAIFFHGLMLTMATLNKKIQEATFNTEFLMKMIESNNGKFLLAKQEEKA
jgi:hypothetical protein